MNVTDTVREIIATVIGRPLSECRKESTLMTDLQITEKEFDQILEEINAAFGTQFSLDQMISDIRGHLSVTDFSAQGVIQDLGLERLKKVLPEVNAALIKTGLLEKDIPRLLTVGTLTRLVSEKLDPNYEYGRSRFVPLKVQTRDFFKRLFKKGD